MFDPEEFRPGASGDAFGVDGEDAEAAQAAQLVVLAVTLGSSLGEARTALMDEAPALASEMFDLPPLPPLYLTESWQLVDLVVARMVLPRIDRQPLLGSQIELQALLGSAMQDSSLVQGAWEELRRSRDPIMALAFLAAHLWSPSPLLRAIGLAGLTRANPGMRFLEAAALDLLNGDDEVRSLGEVALKNLRLDTSRRAPLMSESLSPFDGRPLRSVLLNGTFSGLASARDWFWPTSGIANHIREDTPADLYDDVKSFYRWGGSFSASGRKAAADQLASWTTRRQFHGLHMVFAHSHGGNVAFDYLQTGGAIELLVLLHTPIIDRSRSSWSAIAANVGRVLVLSTKLDWVVWLDRAASSASQREPLIRSLETVLGDQAITISDQIGSAWLSHTHYTKEATWRRHSIANTVGYHHGETHRGTSPKQ